MECVGCSQRTVYYGIEYGKKSLLEMNDSKKLRTILEAKRRKAEALESKLRVAWRKRRRTITTTRQIEGFDAFYDLLHKKAFGNRPQYEEKTIIEPQFTFSDALKWLGRLGDFDRILSRLEELSDDEIDHPS